MRLKKSRILIKFIIIINLTSVKLFRLYIYKKLIEFIVNSTTFSRSGDYYKINNNLRFNDAISDRRKYKIILFIL